MNGLEVFRAARPAVAPLDEATASDIHQAVFGGARRAEPLPAPWRKLALAAACVTVLAASALAAALVRHNDQPAIAPATSGATETSSPSPPTTASSTVSIDDWRDHPERRFQRSIAYSELFAEALDSATGRCMTALGFDYRGNPYKTDSAVPVHREAGTYEAAYFGETDADGGCLAPVLAQMWGPTNADQFANSKVLEMLGTWQRTALAEPRLQGRLAELAECARTHGAKVRDSPDRPNKVYDDILKGIQTLVLADERLQAAEQGNPRDFAAQRMLSGEIADEFCTDYSAFEAAYTEATRLVQVAWIEANPVEMTRIQAEFDEDISRFRYIIEHAGEFPSS